MSNTVHLDRPELAMAVSVGVRRRFVGLQQRDNHGLAEVGPGWDRDIESACAECAVGKFMNIYWDGSVNTYKKPDLGSCIQVRSSAVTENRSLIVRPDDADSHFFVLVLGVAPEFTIAGGIWGGDAKAMRHCHRQPGQRPGAWFIPQGALLAPSEWPMTQLIEQASA